MEFRDKIREKLIDVEVQPSPEVWEKIDYSLGKPRNRKPLVYFLIPAILAIGIVSYIFVFNKATETKKQNSEHVFRKKTQFNLKSGKKDGQRSEQKIEKENHIDNPQGEKISELKTASENLVSTKTEGSSFKSGHNISSERNNQNQGQKNINQKFPQNQLINNQSQSYYSNAVFKNSSNEISFNKLYPYPMKRIYLDILTEEDLNKPAKAKINSDDKNLISKKLPKSAAIWSVGISGGLELVPSLYSSNESSSEKALKEFEEPWQGVNVNGQVGFRFSKHLMVRTGIGLSYYEISHKTFESQGQEGDNSLTDPGPGPAPPSDEYKFQSPGPPVPTEPEQFLYPTDLYYLSVPLLLQYQAGMSRFKFIALLGGQYNYLYGKNEELVKLASAHSFLFETKVIPVSDYSIEAVGQLGMGYQVTNKLTLRILPEVNIPFNSFYDRDYPVKKYPVKTGLNIGLDYSF